MAKKVEARNRTRRRRPGVWKGKEESGKILYSKRREYSVWEMKKKGGGAWLGERFPHAQVRSERQMRQGEQKRQVVRFLQCSLGPKCRSSNRH